MPAIKDKCIVIPLESKDILNTVESLPRLPSESGIIDIQWKRQIGQKNAHLQAKVDPTRIFNALDFLRQSGNKYYMNTLTEKEYENRCKNEDPVGFNLIYKEATERKEYRRIATPQFNFFADGSSEPILELDSYLELKEEQNLEQQ